MVRLTQRLIPLHNVNRALQLTKGMRRLYCLFKEEANIPPQYEQSLTLFSNLCLSCMLLQMYCYRSILI